jgi:putative transposase
MLGGIGTKESTSVLTKLGKTRFKNILISKDRYLLTCGSYVEWNPVRVRLVKDPKDYRWSRYNSYVYGKEDSVVDEHPIYQGLSRDEAGRKRRYREFVMGRLQERQRMRGEMDRRVIYRDKALTAKIKKDYKIEEVIRPRGRPRKKGLKNRTVLI